MGKVNLYTNVGPNSLGIGATAYAGIAGFIGSVTEAVTQIPARTLGTYSNLTFSVTSNDTATTTVNFRINLANGNQVLSITGSTTGVFQDNVNTDSPTAGQLVNVAIVVGAGGTTFIASSHSVAFLASTATNTVTRIVSAGGGNQTLNGVTQYTPLGERGVDVTATEADTQFKFKTAGTLQNLCVNIRTNSKTVTSTVGTRVGGVNGNQTISITSSTTGILEDTTHTDSIASGNLVNYYTAFGADANILRFNYIGVEFLTTTGSAAIISAWALMTQAANLTQFYNLANAFAQTEALCQNQAVVAVAASNLACYLNANTVTAASTLRLRKNGGNGLGAVSITSSTTGYFEDAVHTDSLASTDLINFSIVTGATGTSLAVISMGLLTTIPSDPPFWFDPVPPRYYSPTIVSV